MTNAPLPPSPSDHRSAAPAASVSPTLGSSPCGGFSETDCRDAAAELYTYLDGALTEERKQLIAAHLDACVGCFDAFEFHAELKALISARCHCEAPEGLRERIRAAVSELAQSESTSPKSHPDFPTA